MKDVVDKCSTKGCAIDVGTIIDNEDCVYRAEKLFPSREEAESTVAAVRERAAAAAPASEPPQVDYTLAAAGDEVKLDLSIAFSCQAEKIIFELSLRNLLYSASWAPAPENNTFARESSGEVERYSKRQARFSPIP